MTRVLRLGGDRELGGDVGSPQPDAATKRFTEALLAAGRADGNEAYSAGVAGVRAVLARVAAALEVCRGKGGVVGGSGADGGAGGGGGSQSAFRYVIAPSAEIQPGGGTNP